MSEIPNDEEDAPTLIQSISRETNEALRHAACIGTSPSVFDAYEFPQAWGGLSVCSRCPRNTIWACLQKVAPHRTWFDGVAGGMVWRSGIVQTITGKTIHLTDNSLKEYFEERNLIQTETENEK